MSAVREHSTGSVTRRRVEMIQCKLSKKAMDLRTVYYNTSKVK